MKKVLIVDDDHDIVQAIEAILLMEHYQVVHSYSGKESILLAKKEQPQLILLDYMLPDIKGKELVYALREQKELKTTPILFISAAHGLDHIIQELPIQGFLKKPFELNELLLAVSTHIHKPKNIHR